jgi:hypothetical protein
MCASLSNDFIQSVFGSSKVGNNGSWAFDLSNWKPPQTAINLKDRKGPGTTHKNSHFHCPTSRIELWAENSLDFTLFIWYWAIKKRSDNKYRMFLNPLKYLTVIYVYVSTVLFIIYITHYLVTIPTNCTGLTYRVNVKLYRRSRTSEQYH